MTRVSNISELIEGIFINVDVLKHFPEYNEHSCQILLHELVNMDGFRMVSSKTLLVFSWVCFWPNGDSLPPLILSSSSLYSSEIFSPEGICEAYPKVVQLFLLKFYFLVLNTILIYDKRYVKKFSAQICGF